MENALNVKEFEDMMRIALMNLAATISVVHTHVDDLLAKAGAGPDPGTLELSADDVAKLTAINDGMHQMTDQLGAMFPGDNGQVVDAAGSQSATPVDAGGGTAGAGVDNAGGTTGASGDQDDGTNGGAGE